MRYAAITERLRTLGGDKWAVHNAARARRDAGEDIIELTIGEPDISPAPELIEHCVASLRAGRTQYSNGRGEPGLVDALVEAYRPRHPQIGAENVLCFPGTQTALFAVMLGLVGPGEGVLATTGVRTPNVGMGLAGCTAFGSIVRSGASFGLGILSWA